MELVPYLMEFAEMRGVHGLVPEDPVDGEIAFWGKSAFLIGQAIQHLQPTKKNEGKQSKN